MDIAMNPRWKFLLLAAASVALLSTGCAHDVTGSPVAADGQSATGVDENECTVVDAPLDAIPTRSATEPVLRIPVPDGWERNRMMDSPVIRYTIVSTDLVNDGFSTNAVVTLESMRGSQPPDEVFASNRDNLVSGLGAYGLEVENNSTCGLPSETTFYMAPAMGAAPERPVIMHAVVAETAGATYLATVTIQTTDAENPQFIEDSLEIVDGFQMVVGG